MALPQHSQGIVHIRPSQLVPAETCRQFADFLGSWTLVSFFWEDQSRSMFQGGKSLNGASPPKRNSPKGPTERHCQVFFWGKRAEPRPAGEVPAQQVIFGRGVLVGVFLLVGCLLSWGRGGGGGTPRWPCDRCVWDWQSTGSPGLDGFGAIHVPGKSHPFLFFSFQQQVT